MGRPWLLQSLQEFTGYRQAHAISMAAIFLTHMMKYCHLRRWALYSRCYFASLPITCPLRLRDGNVMRVARYFGIKTDILSPKEKAVRRFIAINFYLPPVRRNSTRRSRILAPPFVNPAAAFGLSAFPPVYTAYGEGRTAQYPVKAKPARKSGSCIISSWNTGKDCSEVARQKISGGI